MKKSHIFGILIIAVAIIVIISTAGDASSYVTFKVAKEMALAGNDSKIHVVGHLPKSENGEVTGVQDGPDKVSFSFMMLDENNEQYQVYYNEPMPTDFLKSEQVVVVGAFHDEYFVADKILMKCPSKYEEETVEAGI